MMASPLERMLSRTMVTDACWIWLGGRDTQGYGQISVNNRLVGVHRLSYQEHVGPIANGAVIDHLCHDPSVCVGGPCPHRLCVNPAHLRAATVEDNSARQVPAFKTHCVRGHLYTELTTGRNRSGTRYCKACRSEQAAQAAANRKAAHTRARAIRQWARARGIPISSRGRIPAAVVAAYESDRAA